MLHNIVVFLERRHTTGFLALFRVQIDNGVEPPENFVHIERILTILWAFPPFQRIFSISVHFAPSQYISTEGGAYSPRLCACLWQGAYDPAAHSTPKKMLCTKLGEIGGSWRCYVRFTPNLKKRFPISVRFLVHFHRATEKAPHIPQACISARPPPTSKPQSTKL